MAITITLVDISAAQMAAIAAVLSGGGVMPEVAQAKPKAAAKAAGKAEPEAAEPEAASGGADVPTIEDVTAAAQALVKANGRDALKERLEQHGATNLSSIPDNKRAAFIASCT